jgi:TonB family protein
MLSFPQQTRSLFILIGCVLFAHALMMIWKLQVPEVLVGQAESSLKVKLIQEVALKAHPKIKRQIVQSEDSQLQEKASKDSFLSDKDRRFERETIAKTISQFKEAALGKSAVTQKKMAQKTAHKKKAQQDIKLSDVGFEASELAPFSAARSPASISGLENGRPMNEGLSATNDYVDEVALGDFTRLNTVEYKHYGFFHRIRQKLEQFWGSSIKEKANHLFKAGRRLPANENLITSLQITLNQKGEIIGVKILGTSGVKELDDAAIESFNLAGPFPNPPQDLLKDGQAVIEWGFVVKG